MTTMAHANDDNDDLDPRGTDALAALLRRADAAAGAAPHAPDLAARVVRRRDTRRRRARRAVATLAVLVLAAGAWRAAELGRAVDPNVEVAKTTITTQTTKTTITRAELVAIDVAAARRELADLTRECAAREQAVRVVLAAGERRRADQASRGHRHPRAAAPTDVLMELQWQREQAALVLVRQGDRLAGELMLPEPAAIAYRQASETFPGTRSAEIARARLAGAEPALP